MRIKSLSGLLKQATNAVTTATEWTDYFGANWKAQADYQISISTGVDYFLQKVVEFWYEYVKD